MAVPQGLYGTSGCKSVTDGGVLPFGCLAGLDIVWDIGPLAAGASQTVHFTGLVTASGAPSNGVPNGYLIRATSRVSDVAGARARAAVTVVVHTGP